MDTTSKAIIEHGIDGLEDMISYGEDVPTDELHNRLYNEDYFVIGIYRAKQMLEDYGVFGAIEKIRNYEQEQFGEVTNDLSDPEKVLNMLAYIKGEEALEVCNSCDIDKDSYTIDDLKQIKKELEAQL